MPPEKALNHTPTLSFLAFQAIAVFKDNVGYMRLGHETAGSVRVATDYHQMVKWALILSGEVSQNVLAIPCYEQCHTEYSPYSP